MNKLLAALCIAGLAHSAWATDTMVTGTISELDTVTQLGGAPGNGDLRVFLHGVSSFCTIAGGDTTWAFVNANDSNYKAALATLMLADATGKQVNVYSRPGSIVGAGTFCQISWIQIIG